MELITLTNDNLDVPTIPLKDGSQYKPDLDLIAEWKRAYPLIDVIDQLHKMRLWCLCSPERRKTKRGVNRFINGWLSRQKPEPAAGAIKTRDTSVSLIASDSSWAE